MPDTDQAAAAAAAAAAAHGRPFEDWRPIPDPTLLTTQQTLREVASTREILEARLGGMDKAIVLLQTAVDKSPSTTELYARYEEKFLSINTLLLEKFHTISLQLIERDKAIQLVQKLNDDNKDTIDIAVDRLRQLHEEKFKSIQTQFQERDIRTEQTARDSKVAVDAALQAAKEAVGEQNKSSALAISKSEAATTKQIDQISTLIATGQKGLDDKIDDIKTRLTSIEGQKQGVVDTKQTTATNWGLVFGAIGMFVGILGIALAIAVFMKG